MLGAQLSVPARKSANKAGLYAMPSIFADNSQSRLTVQRWRKRHLAWIFFGSSACPVFFQPWSNPQSEIGIGVAEAHQTFGDASSRLSERVSFRRGRA